MNNPLSAMYLIRTSGEIGLKSNNVRSEFHRQLKKNIITKLKKKSITYKLDDEWGRLFLSCHLENKDDLENILKTTFGVHSFSPIEVICEPKLETIIKQGTDAFTHAVRGKTFKVSAKRTAEYSFNSDMIHRQLGAALNRSSGASVKLKDPDVTVKVEVRKNNCFMYKEVIPGSKGLPIGTGGKVLCLLSGGFDSAVAAWSMLKRGLEVDFIYFDFDSELNSRTTRAIAKTITDKWSPNTGSYLFTIPFQKVVEEIRTNVPEAFAQITLKRMFYRCAQKLVESNKRYHALVTGDALAQVSSQTLTNLATTDDVISKSVLRPLISYDKDDIIQLSKIVGNHDLSARIKENCQLTKAKPITHCSPSMANEAETNFDFSTLEDSMSNKEGIPLDNLEPLGQFDILTIDFIPKEATVIDCRTLNEFEEWHHPSAIHREIYEFNELKDLPKDKIYLLYCSIGSQSTLIAEKMQRRGYQAFSFKGGAPKLRK